MSYDTIPPIVAPTIESVYNESPYLKMNYNLRKPRENHNPCYGRGYVGTREGKPVLCGCVLKLATAEERLKRFEAKMAADKLALAAKQEVK
jgi:hypothetical protein